ncbi:MAG: hypothetical protein AAFQ27_03830 [Pseudomonadota bacterium]
MIFPLLAFAMFDQPDMSPTDAGPIVLRVTDQESGKLLDQMELCSDTAKHLQIDFDDFENRPLLTVSMSKAGAIRLAAITTKFVGYEIDVVMDGEVIVSPRVMEPLLGDGLQISGIDTIAQAEQLMQSARGRCTDQKAQTE